MEKEKQTQSVKICPICSNSEIAFAQSPVDNRPKPMPKFVPMGCLGKVCKFYNEEMGECYFVIQTVALMNIAGKYLNMQKKGEECPN